MDKKYQTVKLSNAVLQKSVLSCVGGIELMCFGPTAFRLLAIPTQSSSKAPPTESTTSAQLSTAAAAASAEKEEVVLVLQSAVCTEIMATDMSATFREQYRTWIMCFANFLLSVGTTYVTVKG